MKMLHAPELQVVFGDHILFLECNLTKPQNTHQGLHDALLLLPSAIEPIWTTLEGIT